MKDTPKKRSQWTGPRRRATGTENIPARPDAGPRPEGQDWHNGAKVKKP